MTHAIFAFNRMNEDVTLLISLSQSGIDPRFSELPATV